MDRVLDAAAVQPGMKISRGAAYIDLYAADTAQRHQQNRLGLAVLPAVGADRQITGEARLVLAA